jgi:hypothetical protein
MTTSSRSKAIIIIPFRFTNRTEIVNLIQKQVSSVSLKKFIDRTKYFDFITDKFGTLEEKKELFSISCLDISLLKNSQGFRFKEKYNQCNFYLDSNLEISAQFSNLWILLNSLVDIGYLFFEINIDYQSKDIIGCLQNQKVFRFFNLEYELKKNTERKKYSFKVQKNEKIIDYVCLHDVLNNFFLPTSAHSKTGFSFIHSKPIQFHIIPDAESSYNNLQSKCYNILRIPTSSNGSNNQHFHNHFLDNNHVTIDSTYFFALNEGAIIIDPNRTMDEAFSMYCPLILMVINQRELILNENFLISNVIRDRLQNNLSDYERLSRLEIISRNINDARLSQFFYTISTYSELDLFFKILQKQMKIDILLNDINESIDGVKEILQQEEDHRSNVKRDLIGIIISIIGISGLLSFLIDFDASTFSPKSLLLFIGIILSIIITLLFYSGKLHSIVKNVWAKNK